jgi:hypothetical protein
MTNSTGKPIKRHKKQIIDSEEVKRIKRRQAPGKTVETRENQLISLAVDLAVKQIKNGTASSQVITHFLKLGSTQAQLEKAKLDKENQLLEAKTAALQSQKKVEMLYSNAMKAFRSYSGQEVLDEEDD